MKNTVLFNPAISSFNLGDHIIALGAKKQIEKVIKDDFIVEVSSHLPISRLYMRHVKNADKKFVLGSNLLRGKMNRLFRQWDIRMDQIDLLQNSILVGVGWWQYGDEPNLYTKTLYKNVLSNNYIHSVRDGYTEKKLKSMGIDNVLNTACATMWDLTEEHCSQIKKGRSESVVFTITDYKKNKEKDEYFINVLKKFYKNIYFWPQGLNDYQYYMTLNVNFDEIKLLHPNLVAYDNLLEKDEVDFVGTRLHAGIRALQKKRRTIIIGVDNRANEKQKNFNLTVIDRENLEELEQVINSEFSTEIIIPIKKINEWKEQFN